MRRHRDPQDAIELQCPVCHSYIEADPSDRFEDTQFTEEPCDECEEKEDNE